MTTRTAGLAGQAVRDLEAVLDAVSDNAIITLDADGTVRLLRQSEYNARLKALAPLMEAALRWLASHTPATAELLRLMDATPVPGERDQARQTLERQPANRARAQHRRRHRQGPVRTGERVARIANALRAALTVSMTRGVRDYRLWLGLSSHDILTLWKGAVSRCSAAKSVCFAGCTPVLGWGRLLAWRTYGLAA